MHSPIEVSDKYNNKQQLHFGTPQSAKKAPTATAARTVAATGPPEGAAKLTDSSKLLPAARAAAGALADSSLVLAVAPLAL